MTHQKKNDRRRREEVTQRVVVPRETGANATEPTIGMWSVSEWQKIVRRNDEWAVLLDNIGAEPIDEIVGICGDPDAEVRFLGATMLRHVGASGLSEAQRVEVALAVLENLSRDRRRKTRAIALQARDEIIEHQEEERAGGSDLRDRGANSGANYRALVSTSTSSAASVRRRGS